ncbi:MAG: hypothetical protein AAF183_24555, partial [Pseudomonadota bacterium]
PHTPCASLRDVNARFRDELLNSEIFFSLREAAPRANDPLERFLILGSLIEQWRRLPLLPDLGPGGRLGTDLEGRGCRNE